MEIAVFRFDGQEVPDQIISLVHPHRSVQKYVSKMTGITEKMLVRAPRFHEIAKRIVKITEDAILVGHNVEFDYRMLRQEFARLGYPFERKTLDTIKLAEELIPGLKSYGLDQVCDELGIYRNNKHRAESDARATLELFKILSEKDRQKKISIMGQSVIQGDSKKEKLSDLQRSVKENKGLFYLHDHQGKLLYLGASDNIKSAIGRLFISQAKNAESLQGQVTSVKIEPVGNWLVARIKKNEELRSARPAFNRFKEGRLEVGVFADQRESPPRLYHEELDKAGKKNPLLKALNRKMATRALRMYGRMGKAAEREKILNLLQEFPTDAVFQGNGRKSSERCAFVVKESQLVGYAYFSLSDQISHGERLKKNMTAIPPREEYTELLKLGVLSREFGRVL